MIDYRYIDMHCHLDFASRAADVARAAKALGIAAFSTTVAPEGYLRARKRFATCDNIAIGLGLHPWWEHEQLEERLGAFEHLAPTCSFIGEVGLDFSKRCAVEPDEQIKVFRRLLAACLQPRVTEDAGCSDSDFNGCSGGNSGSCSNGGSDGNSGSCSNGGSDGNSDDGSNGGKLFSIHAIQSVTAVLDLLEEMGSNTPQHNSVILHWFSGSTDELSRAIKLGCFFSVGPHMLKSKRGREYARVIPLKQLLFETDEPPEGSTTWNARQWLEALEGTCTSIASLRHIEPEALRTTVAQTSRGLLRQYGLP